MSKRWKQTLLDLVILAMRLSFSGHTTKRFFTGLSFLFPFFDHCKSHKNVMEWNKKAREDAGKSHIPNDKVTLETSKMPQMSFMKSLKSRLATTATRTTMTTVALWVLINLRKNNDKLNWGKNESFYTKRRVSSSEVVFQG